MFKTLMLVAVLFFAAMAQFNSQTGKYIIAANQATSEALGYSDTYFLDASGGNATAPTTTNANWDNCRGISSDSTGVVKISYINNEGTIVNEVTMLIGGIIRPVRNVTKLWQYTSGTTAGTAKSYTAAGVITTNAIKLHR